MAIAACLCLRQFDGSPGVTIAMKGEALELLLVRDDLDVRVTVPKNVLEWFVDVEHRASGSRATDWCDYEGYDNTPRPVLEERMANEVAAFVGRLVASELRCVVDSKRPNQCRLEWWLDTYWHQAVPFSEPAT